MRKSGYVLKPGDDTSVRGVYIINRNNFPVYVDKYTPKKKKARGGKWATY